MKNHWKLTLFYIGTSKTYGKPLILKNMSEEEANQKAKEIVAEIEQKEDGLSLDYTVE